MQQQWTVRKKQTSLQIIRYHSTILIPSESASSNPKRDNKMIIEDEAELTSPINLDISIEELKDAIQICHQSSPGPDEIHYQMIQNLPKEALNVTLQLFNLSWKKGRLPSSWKHSYICPIQKPGKDPCHVSSYRPISFTSCLCKTMERIINNRLIWFLERYQMVSETQSGFR